MYYAWLFLFPRQLKFVIGTKAKQFAASSGFNLSGHSNTGIGHVRDSYVTGKNKVLIFKINNYD